MKVVLAAWPKLTGETCLPYGEHARAVAGHHFDMARQLGRLFRSEVAEVGDRLGRSLGRDDIFIGLRRFPAVRGRKQLGTERIFMRERPVFVFLGVIEATLSQFLKGFL